MSDTFDPYHVWLGIPPESRPPTHYELLGISPNEREAAVINAAVTRQSAYVRNFQIGKYASDAARILNEIAAAKACLLDPTKRAKYDEAIKARKPAANYPIQAAPRVTLAAPAPTLPTFDIDLLAKSAAPPAVYRSRTPGRPSVPQLLGKAKRARQPGIAWQAVAGVGIGVVIALAAALLWPRRRDELPAEPRDVVLSGTVQRNTTPEPAASEPTYLWRLPASDIQLYGWPELPPTADPLRESPVAVLGVTYRYGLWMHPLGDGWAQASYALNKHHRTLAGAVAINDSAAPIIEGAAVFKIIVDGKQVWKSSELRARGDFERFEVNVSNADRVDLRVDCIGGIGNCHAVWLDPVLDPPASWVRPPLPPPLAVSPFSGEEARRHQERWAKYLGRQVEETNSIGMKLVLIPPGEFMMGLSEAQAKEYLAACDRLYPSSDEYGVRAAADDERPQHHVRITQPYLIGACEVTTAQFRRFVDDSRYKTDAERSLTGGTGVVAGAEQTRKGFCWRDMGDLKPTDEMPALNISWHDALAFCKWTSRKEVRGYRLPTEAEWEFACRAGTESIWFFGEEAFDTPLLEKYAWYAKNAGHRPHPVAEKLANPFGLYDVYGNAEEWCNDWYRGDYYSSSPGVDPAGAESGTGRARRSGHFGTTGVWLHSAQRTGGAPANSRWLFGFRVVCEVNPSPQGADARATFAPKSLRDRWREFDLGGNAVIDDFVRITHGDLSTRGSYGGPMEISVVARTNKDNIRVHAFGVRGNGEGAERVIWNWEGNPSELRVHRADTSLAIAAVTPLAINTWYRLKWRITANEMNVYADDRLVFHESGGRYIGEPSPVWVETVEGSVVDVKSFLVTPLGPPPTSPALRPPTTPVSLAPPPVAPAVAIDFPGEVDGTKGGAQIAVAPSFDIAKSWRLSLELWAPKSAGVVFFWGDERAGHDAIEVSLREHFAIHVCTDNDMDGVTGPALDARPSDRNPRRWIAVRYEYSASAHEFSLFIDGKEAARVHSDVTPRIDRPMPVYLCHMHGQWRFEGRVHKVQLENVQ
jgi:formylglycine-generating enzyme required for sulfatase activity